MESDIKLNWLLILVHWVALLDNIVDQVPDVGLEFVLHSLCTLVDDVDENKGAVVSIYNQICHRATSELLVLWRCAIILWAGYDVEL